MADGFKRHRGGARDGKSRSRTRFTDASFARSIRQRLQSDDILTEGALRSTHYVFIGFAIIAAIFFLRLVFLQVIVAGEYSAQAEESRTINFEISARRGTIYDRNGEILATSVDATTIYCNPVEVTDARWEAEQLQRVLEGEVEDYEELLSKDSTTFVYIKRQADVDKAEQIKKMELPGIYFIADSRREYPHGATGGQVIGVCDVDGNGIINDNDRQVLGSATPDFFGSFFTRLEWRNWALDLTFAYSHGNKAYNAVRRLTESGKDFSNQSTAVMRRWSMEGQVTDIPRVSYGDKVGNNDFSDRWIEDASYVKLRDITVSYTWDKPFLSFFQGGTIYVTGENLLTATKYLGLDPEFSYSNSTVLQGVDYGKVGAPRSVKLGVNLKF